MPETVEVVANQPRWVFAQTEASDLDDIVILGVWRSIRTKRGQSWMVPVHLVLAESCHSWLTQEKHRDVNMMGGSAWYETYTLYRTCPGEGVRHECQKANTGVLVAQVG